MKFAVAFLATMFALLLSVPALGSPGGDQKCEGPPELCSQILKLRVELDLQKKNADDVKNVDEKQISALHEQKKSQEQKTIKFIGAMSSLAIVLKIVLSLLTKWKDTLFKSDKGKAAIRIAILCITLMVFLATNMGFGIPWWQAVILAAGGPLSMFLHEMMKLIPVVKGQKKLEPDLPAEDPPPAQP